MQAFSPTVFVSPPVSTSLPGSTLSFAPPISYTSTQYSPPVSTPLPGSTLSFAPPPISYTSMRFVPALYETPKRPGATLGQTPVRSSVSAEIADLSLGPLHDQLFGGAAHVLLTMPRRLLMVKLLKADLWPNFMN